MPLRNFIGRVVGRMVQEVTGMCLINLAKLNNQEVLLEFDLSDGVVGIVQEIQKITSWEGLNVGPICLLSGKKHLIDIVREHE